MNPNLSAFNRMCVYVFLAMAGLGFFGLYGLAVSFFVSYWVISYARAVKRRNDNNQGQNGQAGQKLP
jgi:hypothetical protein